MHTFVQSIRPKLCQRLWSSVAPLFVALALLHCALNDLARSRACKHVLHIGRGGGEKKGKGGAAGGVKDPAAILATVSDICGKGMAVDLQPTADGMKVRHHALQHASSV